MDNQALSKQQLLEKLERSEAGRKRLWWQTLGILQQKADASEKVLEVNERLRQECEQERQQAESEKKKAEEERRLRNMLEKDSATFKDQLAKVIQRLGAVENKQKTDKKEMECLRNEVKLSVEGMRASAKAVEMMQSSFQALESKLLEKVKLAYEEAHSTSQAVQSVQNSLSSLEKNLENSVANKGILLEDTAVVPVAAPVSERLISEITYLFEKEKQSHSRIQDRLVMLKSIMKSGTIGSSVGATDSEKSGYVEESAQLKGARKRKLKDEEQILNTKTKRRGRPYHIDMVNSPFCHVVSEEPSSLPGGPLSINTASNDHMDHRGSSTSKAHEPMQTHEVLLQTENEEVCFQRESEKRELESEQKVERVLDISHGASKETVVHKQAVVHKQGMTCSRDEQVGIQARAAGMPTRQADGPRVDPCNDEEFDSDLDFEWSDATEREWFENLILLTPSLPEVASPICGVPFPPREHRLVDESIEEYQSSQLRSDVGMSTHVRANDNGNPLKVQTHAASSLEVLPGLDQPPACKPAPFIAFSPDKSQNGKHFDDGYGIVVDKPQNSRQLDDDYGINEADNAVLTEISSFLEDLPLIPSDIANTLGVSSLSQDPHEPQVSKVSEIEDRVAQDAAIVEQGFKEMATFSTTGKSNAREDDGSNLLAVPRSRTMHPHPHPQSLSSCTVYLLQAFDLDNAATKIDVAAACIVAACFRESLNVANAEKVHEALPSGSADVPLKYLACALISTAVDLLRSKSGAEQLNLEAQCAHAVVLFLVTFIRNTFKEQANSMFDAIFTQLSRFLGKGEGMLITLQGLTSPMIESDVYSVAQMIYSEDKVAYQYIEATLEDVRAGGKVLAALCRVLSCVAHLQSVVYELLGWCGKDVEWLLMVFSSFSSICGHSAFLAEADDLLGCAICAIIIELVASVDDEQGKIVHNDQEVNPKLPHVSSSHLNRWAHLIETLEAKGKFRIEKVLVAVLESLQSLFCFPHDNVVLGSCDSVLRGVPLSDEEANKGAISSGHRSLDSARWQKKYAELLGALELIALFMGWEWTYNHLISRYLWKMVASSSAQVCATGIAHILSALARMGMKSRGSQLPGLDELRKSLAYVVGSPLALASKAESHLLVGL